MQKTSLKSRLLASWRIPLFCMGLVQEGHVLDLSVCWAQAWAEAFSDVRVMWIGIAKNFIWDSREKRKMRVVVFPGGLESGSARRMRCQGRWRSVLRWEEFQLNKNLGCWESVRAVEMWEMRKQVMKFISRSFTACSILAERGSENGMI